MDQILSTGEQVKALILAAVTVRKNIKNHKKRVPMCYRLWDVLICLSGTAVVVSKAAQLAS